MEERVFGRRYRVTEKIGTGGMADVYKAVDETLGRTVAVKVMHPRYASDPTFAARFRQEAQAAANLVSPNIVNMYDWGLDGETYYMVMEYVRGNDLKTIIEQKGALSSRQVAEIGAQVCSALAAAHGYDIIHRDIKPHNIMVQPDGTVKVMDFGIARAGNSTMTQTGSVLGTAHYVSPEQAQGRPLSAASDLYSLGVVLYEAATGNLPFEADTPVAVALKQVNEIAPRPTAMNPDLDPNLEKVIMRAMAKRAEDRYSTADEMRRDLLHVMQGQAVTAPGFVAGSAADETAVLTPVGGHQQAPVRGAGSRTNASRKSAVWPWILVTVLLILAGLGVAWGLGMLGTGKLPTVPDLKGLDRAAATVALEQQGLKLGNATQEFSSDLAVGKIISQTPAAGTQVKKGSAIDIVVSKGPDLVLVPDIVGMTQAQADAALKDLNLVGSATSSAYDPEVPAGSVVSQSPKKDEKIARGSTVTYVISLGQEQATVPAVEGLAQAAATSKLKTAGFKVKAVKATSDTVATGKVISQDKSAGGAYPKGSTVTITVSSGKPQVEIPPVVGQAPEAARDTLVALGLKVAFTYNNVAGTGVVTDQTPKANATVDPGSTVTLEVDGDDPAAP